jgi:lipopolysaccharide/colanic/teichoic acid biosynthesis glycosyltransferase
VKRAFDIAASLVALLLLSPLLGAIALAIWIEDRHSPFYRGVRVSRGGGRFRMLKFRSMRPDAWKSGVNSTASGDVRITRVGAWLRRRKLDELPQLWNVLVGEMSFVGPRPQVEADAALYTAEERRMLEARPGITDLASIVFADESEILAGSANPDLEYNRVIRPWKSRLALAWLEHRSNACDLRVVFLTALALVSRERALAGVARVLETWGVDQVLVRVARRNEPLIASAPPGADRVVEMYPARDFRLRVHEHPAARSMVRP